MADPDSSDSESTLRPPTVKRASHSPPPPAPPPPSPSEFRARDNISDRGQLLENILRSQPPSSRQVRAVLLESTPLSPEASPRVPSFRRRSLVIPALTGGDKVGDHATGPLDRPPSQGHGSNAPLVWSEDSPESDVSAPSFISGHLHDGSVAGSLQQEQPDESAGQEDQTPDTLRDPITGGPYILVWPGPSTENVTRNTTALFRTVSPTGEMKLKLAVRTCGGDIRRPTRQDHEQLSQSERQTSSGTAAEQDSGWEERPVHVDSSATPAITVRHGSEASEQPTDTLVSVRQLEEDPGHWWQPSRLERLERIGNYLGSGGSHKLTMTTGAKSEKPDLRPKYGSEGDMMGFLEEARNDELLDAEGSETRKALLLPQISALSPEVQAELPALPIGRLDEAVERMAEERSLPSSPTGTDSLPLRGVTQRVSGTQSVQSTEPSGIHLATDETSQTSSS